MRALLIAIVCAVTMSAEPRVAWLSGHAVRIRSIEPADDDFRDLEPLRATLANKRIVLLGEQNHADGSTFLAKTRLIRFLHERLGFDVLVFESGMHDCASRPFEECVFPIWSKTEQVQPLIAYVERRNLELAGVDIQSTPKTLLADLRERFAASDDEWQRAERVMNRLGESPAPSTADQDAFVRLIERWQSQVSRHDLWWPVLASLRVYAEQTWRTDFSKHASNPAVFAMRDRRMGENLVWLATEKYPDRKLIVWAATFHNARNLGTIETGDAKLDRLYDGVTPMGEVAYKALGDAVYSIAFTSYEGEKIPKPDPGTLEDLFVQAGFENAFIDLRKGPRWLHAPLIAQLLGHTQMRADWSRVVDGVVFIRRLQRSRRLP